jgi:hypothetical protein
VGPDVVWGLKIGASAAGAQRRALWVAGIAVAAVAIALLPARLCLSAALLHIPCPGCGMTRATLALLHGDLSSALAFHPLSIVIAPLGAAFAVEHATRYVWSGHAAAARSRWREALLLAGVALLITVWIMRFFGSFGGPVAI